MRVWCLLSSLLLSGCKPVLETGVTADSQAPDTAVEADTDTDADTDADTDTDTDTAPDPCSYVDVEGDGAESYTDVGVVCLPATFRGELETVGHDEDFAYTGDYDFVRFQVPTSDRFELELDWSPSNSDYDLYVYRANEVQLIAQPDDQLAQPERVEVSLNAGVYYYISVVGYDGTPGDWWVEVSR